MVNRFIKGIAASLVVGFLASTAYAQEQIKVTMIAYPPGDDFYHTIENGARDEAEALGINLTVQKIPSYDMSAQVAVLNAAIATSPDAILVSPIDINGLQATLNRAKAQGIEIVLYDSQTRDMTVAATFVSADVVEMGRQAARAFLEAVGDKTGTYFYQSTAPAQPYFEAMKKGWNEVLSAHDALKPLPVNYSEFEPAKASSQMQAILTANSDLVGGFAGIFLDQQGIIPAVERAGKAADLVLVGTDGAPQNVQRLRDGKLTALVSNMARDYGVEAIRAAAAAIAGEPVKPVTVIGQCLLTAENVDDPANAACLYDLDQQ